MNGVSLFYSINATRGRLASPFAPSAVYCGDLHFRFGELDANTGGYERARSVVLTGRGQGFHEHVHEGLSGVAGHYLREENAVCQQWCRRPLPERKMQCANNGVAGHYLREENAEYETNRWWIFGQQEIIPMQET